MFTLEVAAMRRSGFLGAVSGPDGVFVEGRTQVLRPLALTLSEDSFDFASSDVEATNHHPELPVIGIHR